MKVEEESLREWVARWKRVGPLLEKQREEDVRRSDTISAFASFAGMPLFNLRKSPPPHTRGLVEQQRWFRKMAGRSTS